MRKPMPANSRRRPKAETKAEIAFDALVDFVCRRCEVESDSQAAQLLGLHPPNIVSYRRSAPVRPSTWQKLFERVWTLGVKEGRKQVTWRLLDAVEDAHGTKLERQVAQAFCVKQPAVAHWRSGRDNPTRRQLRRLIDYSQVPDIRAIAEFRPVFPHRRPTTWALCTKEEKGERAELKRLLSGKKGLYILYDSMGSALYVGQSQKDLFFEIEQRLSKASRRRIYEQGMKKQFRQMGNATRFLSAYEIKGKHVLDRLEALLIRSMANDLENHHMERILHALER